MNNDNYDSSASAATAGCTYIGYYTEINNYRRPGELAKRLQGGLAYLVVTLSVASMTCYSTLSPVTGMGDRLRADIPPRYVITCQLGLIRLLSFASLRGW